MRKKIVFDIHVPREIDAGRLGFEETITVIVDSGDPGGAPEEFEEDLRQFFVEWFDTIHVKVTEISFVSDGSSI